MQKINWGIIGCGDVTELKSGPAFNKVPNSSLLAVMRRDAAKAADYAKRHGVPVWYSNAEELINDTDINAVYIATPPSSHYEYVIAALQAQKMVYVEKPMTTNLALALKMQEAVNEYKGKLVVAHYRRQQPLFKKIKSLIDQDAIGRIKNITLKFYRKNITAAQMSISKYAWRVDPDIAGGGLFHDIAPHQLDLLYYLFGEVKEAFGYAVNTNQLYQAEDTVAGSILFKNNILFTGNWCFDIGSNNEVDHCEIIGENGTIEFAFFDHQQIKLTIHEKTEIIEFEKLQHAQQPMIESVVNYFSGISSNPCPVEDGVVVMKLIEKFTAGSNGSK